MSSEAGGGLYYPDSAGEEGKCGARHDDVTSITCHRPKGHRRDHEGITTVTWEQDDRFCTTHGRAHWDDGDRTCRFTDDPETAEDADRDPWGFEQDPPIWPTGEAGQ